MSRKTITVEGLPGLRAALAHATAELRAASEEAVREETELIQQDAVKFAPRDTGALERSIRGDAVGLTGNVRATARHATFVEHGTSKTPAQPFMGPAATRARRRFPARAKAIISKALGG